VTQPKQARKGRGRDGPRTYAWPPLPPHEFEVISVTSALGAGVAKPWLAGWAAKVTAEAAVEDYEIVGAMLKKGKEREAIAHLKGARYANSGAKADRGTIVHGALEAYLAGKALSKETVEEQLKEAHVPRNLWRSTAAMIAGLMEFLSDEEPEIYWSESTIYSRAHGYAGTADVLGRMRVGGTMKPVVVDVKTSKAIYDDTAAQLCAYARGDFVGLDDGTEAPLTPTGEPIEHGIVVRPTASGKYEKAVFTLTDRVYDYFLGALAVASNGDALAEARRPS
jgi:hypothetical protein